MNKKVYERFLVRVVMLLTASLPALAFADNELQAETLLDSLDNVLANRQALLNKKTMVINELKHGISDMPTQEALTVKYEQIFQEYLHYNGDSAIFYAKKAVQTAARINRPDLLLSARFCLLRAYTRQGSLGKAYETILDIGGITALPSANRTQYADLLLDFYMRVNFKESLDFTPDIDALGAWQRYSAYLGKGTPQYAFYQSVCSDHGDMKLMKQAIAGLKKPSYQAANLYYAMAMECKRKNETNDFYQNIILAAINDVLLGNTEMSSLLTLLQTPLLENNLKRSYVYVQVCSDNVKRYHDMQRSVEVVAVQDRVNKQFNEVRNRQMTTIIIIAILFIIAFAVSIVETRLLAARGKKVKKSLDALKVMHAKQMELLEQQKVMGEALKEANSRLTDRAQVYRNDFLNVYRLISTYISYEKDLRNELSNQLKTNNVRKAIRTLDSSTDIDGQLKQFYHHLDHAFLSMYPDFIHRMNTLVKADSQFDESQNELTTSLRIYALVVLGITDSVGIADFLHLSSQTVYNYRLRMRRCAAHDEKLFDDEVMSLYNNHNAEKQA